MSKTFNVKLTADQIHQVRAAIGHAIIRLNADAEQFAKVEEREARAALVGSVRSQRTALAEAYKALDEGVYAPAEPGRPRLLSTDERHACNAHMKSHWRQPVSVIRPSDQGALAGLWIGEKVQWCGEYWEVYDAVLDNAAPGGITLVLMQVTSGDYLLAEGVQMPELTKVS